MDHNAKVGLNIDLSYTIKEINRSHFLTPLLILGVLQHVLKI